MSRTAPWGPRSQRHLDALALRSPLLLAMDFDGTLAPIVPHAARAKMPLKVGRLIRSLARMKGVSIVVISGRPLAELRRLIPVPGLRLAGIHGLSSNVKGVGMPPAEALRWKGVLRRAKRKIEGLALRGAGLWIEDKGLGLALHLGQASAKRTAQLRGRVSHALFGLPLGIHGGHKILELKPRRGWHKGRALRRLLAAGAPAWRRRGACLFAGDDATDEDAFKALGRLGSKSLSLKIGAGRSAARYRVRSPSQFWELLRRIKTLRTT